MYVVAGSITAAERFKRAAERAIGYPVDVVHTPRAIRRGGCSYSVRIDDRAMDTVKKIARQNGISTNNIYIVRCRNGERVYHAIS